MKKDSTENEVTWDVAVIGGGPAGMMAAGRAAELGAKVILLEKNPTLGNKLLISGGGRSNVTNATPNAAGKLDVRTFLKKYKDSDKFLFSAFSQWDVEKSLAFFHLNQMPTKTEAEGRVFPASNTAQSVWNVLVEYMKKGGVTVRPNSEVTKFIVSDKAIMSLKLKGGTEIKARSFVLATGGTSRPETGSTGDGFKWLKELGHKVIDSDAALVPVAVKDEWTRRLQGVTLTGIKLTTFQNDQKQESVKGKILFTHFGITGPTVLNMSRDIGELLKYGDVTIKLDLLPSLDHGQLNTALQDLFKKDTKKKIKNSLNSLIPSALVEAVLTLSATDPEITNSTVSREQRLALIETIKGMPMKVAGLLGSDKAVVSSGGVSLDEVDFKTMRSRIVPNLYLTGDILNIDRPSGGYSLQLCWTTGYVAGNDAGKALK